VIGKSLRDDQVCYYLNDGVYNNFSGIIFDKAQYPIYTEHCFNESNPTYNDCKLFGPTCDNLDTICESIKLPEMELNDVIIATHIGAYSRANATNFNFLGHTNIQFVN
jgi:ornithine decarboxylase